MTDSKTGVGGMVRLLTTACLVAAVFLSSHRVCLAQDSDTADAWRIDRYYIYTSLYTRHYESNAEHNNKQNMLGLELQMDNHWVLGMAFFDNSYDQPSQYIYGGYRWGLFQSPDWYFKLTGGLVHGYKGPHQDKIPFNALGIAPGAVPTLGYQHKALVAEINLAGLAAFVITAGVRF